jgi:ribosomal protein L11 methyltransferase
MFSIDLDCSQEDSTQEAKDLLVAELWEAGCSGIVELGETGLRVFFDDDARQSELLARFGGEAEPADTRDWVEFAHEYLKPMEIGQRIFVCPEWRHDATPPGRIRIEVNAGLAFGTGAHETTRLCLEAIERHLRPGMTVVDVGTGSGILAEAAVKLGAGVVQANDNDPEAVAVARENFEKAGLAIDVSVGSADAFPEDFADLIVANISPAWISDLAPEWVRVLKPGGIAILSGFEAADVPRVSAALEKAGARVTGEFGEQEWRMLEATRKKFELKQNGSPIAHSTG